MSDTIFQPLLNCQDASSLEFAVSKNLDEITQWATSQYSDLLTCRMPLRQLVQVKCNLLAELDFSNSANRAFVVLLHDVCCAINLSGPATILYNIIQEHRLVLGCRLEAAMMVLRSYGSNDDFVEIFVPLCEKLQFAIQNEEDDESRCIAVFIRFYALVVRDLHDSYVSLVQNRIAAYKSTYHFLNNETIRRASSISISDKQDAYFSIINMLADITSESKVEDSQEISSVTTAFEFSSQLALCAKNFRSIRELACRMLSERDLDEEEVFRSLGRGVRVLTNEDQLLIYLKSYGAMHEAKLQASYEQFDFGGISSTVRVIDWGCGQAVATMTLLEYLQEHGIDINIEEIILIEPSSIALERAKLYVHHFNSNVAIKTINKGFDELVVSDLGSANGCETIHLFSNVLDYEGYDIYHLQNVISSSLSNANHFICASPYINETKVNRINSFEQYFSNFPNYKHIYDVNNLAGTWKGTWTRVIRVFSIEMYDVFISYATRDMYDASENVIPSNPVLQIQTSLTDAGISFWIDRQRLIGGTNYAEEIARQIQGARVVLYLSSGNSNASSWTANEIATASAYGKQIIPVRLDQSQYNSSIMIYIAGLQYITLYNNPLAMQQLIEAINQHH